MPLLRRLLACAGVAGLWLVVAPAAVAGTASVKRLEYKPDKGPTVVTYALEFDAAAGEANDMTVAPTSKGVYDVTDGANAITAGPGCRLLSAARVSCGPRVNRVSVQAGDGSDKVTVIGPHGLSARVSGGPGDDALQVEVPDYFVTTLLGGPGNDVLVGGRAGDFLYGEEGRDSLHGGGGMDTLVDGDRTGFADDDVLDGGRDRDRAMYDTRTDRLFVDLARGEAVGSGGDRDVLKSIDEVRTGSGPDLLRGSPGDDGLDGGEGEDVAIGGRGNDVLYAEHAHGGPGDDSLHNPTTLSCGHGRDHVDSPATETLIPQDCDRILLLYPSVAFYLRESRRSLRAPIGFFRSRCNHGSRRCIITTAVYLELAGRRVRIGRYSTKDRPGHYFTVPLVLSARGARLVRGHPGEPVVARGRVVARGDPEEIEDDPVRAGQLRIALRRQP